MNRPVICGSCGIGAHVCAGKTGWPCECSVCWPATSPAQGQPLNRYLIDKDSRIMAIARPDGSVPSTTSRASGLGALTRP